MRNWERSVLLKLEGLFYSFIDGPHYVAWGILVPGQGSNSSTLRWERGVSAMDHQEESRIRVIILNQGRTFLSQWPLVELIQPTVYP